MFDFRNKINIGNQRAEVDEKYLRSHFLKTPTLKLVNGTDHSIVIGRKGSGKSALRFHIASEMKDKQKFVINITPTEQEFREFFDHIFNEHRSNLSLEYINKIWELTIIFRLLDTVSKSVNANVAHNLRSQPEYAALLSNSINTPMGSVINHIKTNNIDENSLYDLNEKIRNYLFKIVKATGNHFYIFIDSIDDTIHREIDTTNRNDSFSLFFSGLLDFFRWFTDPTQNPLANHITIKLFVPTDIYNWSIERHADHLRQYKNTIKWDRNELARFMYSRFVDNIDAKSRRELNRIDNENTATDRLWENLFPLNFTVEYYTETAVKTITKDAKDLFLDHTLRRPRDLMEIIRLVSEVCIEKNLEKPDKAAVIDALNRYSTSMKESVVEEYRTVLRNIDDILASFVGNSPRISKASLTNILTKDRLLKTDAEIRSACQILHEACIIGIPNRGENAHVGRGIYYYDDADFSKIWQSREFQIHPAFWNSMGLTKLRNFS